LFSIALVKLNGEADVREREQAGKFNTGSAALPRYHPLRLTVQYPLLVFFVLAYLFSWAVFLPMIYFRGPIQLTIIASFGPSLAALITHRLSTGSYHAFRLYTTLTRTVSAAVLGTGLIILTYVSCRGLRLPIRTN
jgi:hypothetical protein